MGPPLTYPQEGVSTSYMIACCHCRPGAGPPAAAFLVLCLLLSSSSKFFILALCPTAAPVGLSYLLCDCYELAALLGKK